MCRSGTCIFWQCWHEYTSGKRACPQNAHILTDSDAQVKTNGQKDAPQYGVNFRPTPLTTKPRANSRPQAAQAPQHLTPDSSPLTPAVVRSDLRPSLVRGDSPRNAPLNTMPRWRRVAGVLSVPPVAHPRRAAKPSAVTTVGAGLVPAHAHPKIWIAPSQKESWITQPILAATFLYCLACRPAGWPPICHRIPFAQVPLLAIKVRLTRQ